METTLYDDNSSSPPDAKKRKVNMTLDLQPANKTKQEKLNELLATPDVGMFMLTSPDLERFIIQQNGLVLTTPTPTTQILFPKSVTEEQEAYARGFVDALSELHKNYGPPTVSSTVAPSVVAPSVGAQKPGAGTTVVNLSTVTSLPAVSAATQPSLLPGSSVKAEPGRTSSTVLPPPADIRPIDMDEQEMAKLERKRARNRQAATRCRNRKLERIARLEERVAELKGQNSQLQQSASALRDEVSRLKHAIIEHTRRGCQVMMTHNLL